MKIFDGAKIRWRIVQVEAINAICQTYLLYDPTTYPGFNGNSIVVKYPFLQNMRTYMSSVTTGTWLRRAFFSQKRTLLIDINVKKFGYNKFLL